MDDTITAAPAAAPAPAPAPAAAPAAPTTAAQASEQRATLMRDQAFTAAALKPSSAQWAQLAALDRLIAPPDDDGQAHQEARDAQAPAAGPAHADDDEQAPAGFYDPPATAAGYSLPVHEARQAGLQIPPEVDIALRQGFHAAGVDQHLANLLYTSATRAAVRGVDEVELAAEHFNTQAALRQRWGAAYEANLAAANAEARAVFEFLPASITDGQSFEQYMRSSGLGNSRLLIEQLLLRAKARKARR